MVVPVYESLLDGIGGTPLVRLARMAKPNVAEVWGKLEAQNPGGSVKDRIALRMIEAAERDGCITPGRTTIVEATTGNTGIGLALVCAVKGYRLVVAMPESMSLERRAMLRAYGARIELTKAELGMAGAIERAAEIAAAEPDAFMPRQFDNLANPEAHRRTTFHEIVEGLGGRTPDAFVAGIGTGGTITGVGQLLKARAPTARVVGVEPAASPVLSGGAPGRHEIQGIGVGFVPAVLDRGVIDEVRAVRDRDAYDTKVALAQREGLLVGISSGAAVFVALDVARALGPGHVVVAILPDTGERDFSLDEFFS
ncbi:MAG: cysteine synthase A [Myxococcota bacterium]